jgi:hypothetical protein
LGHLEVNLSAEAWAQGAVNLAGYGGGQVIARIGSASDYHYRQARIDYGA